MMLHSICLVIKLSILLQLMKEILSKERIVVHWECDCRNNFNVDIEDLPFHTTCHTHGVDLKHISKDEEENNSMLWSFSKGAVAEIINKCFIPHNKTLKEISITRMKYLDEFDKHAFRHLSNLQAIVISNAPVLRFLPAGIFPLKTLRVLRITHTGLEVLPTLPGLSKNIMHILDFESNKIKMIKSNALSIKTEQLILDYNNIAKIEGWAFNGSQIGKLSLKGNRALTELSHDAFRGLDSLRDLDLSETSITNLPVLGLESLETLILMGTNTLKIIPSIHDLKSLRVAKLTYSFHCCAFQYPARHDPVRHELHVEYLARVKELCRDTTKTTLSNTKHVPNNGIISRSKRNSGGYFGPIIITNTASIISSSNNIDMHNYINKPLILNPNTPMNGFNSLPLFNKSAVMPGWSDIEIDSSFDGSSNNELWEEPGVFHDTVPPVKGNSRYNAVCGNLTIRRVPVDCYPKPDALNPCEDIMGYNWLRISVWFVICTALFGNTAVLVVLLANRSDTNVPRFLMMNLAFSDFLMAVYLLLLASSDLQSTGVYFNYAYDWQRGYGCKLAGVLTVFSSQLSVYTLSLITVERWFTISHALYANKIDLCVASYAMIFGWLYSVVMALLPLFGISNYSTTSICLPMDIQTLPSTIYVLTLLSVTGIAFILICVCYIQIYQSLGKETRHSSGESSVARKMMLLVGTNFACYAPTAFFSLTAFAGYPLIDVTRSKILLVFFYPINSCANPYLYAIMTSQYRKQLIQLLARCGFCTEFAQQYKLVYSPDNKCVQKIKSKPVPLHKKLFLKSKSSVASEDAV
ncbi:follicle-stimulating hormone receptor-like [Lycorma delicatula]|uniref:follicle-stimulating hormone receptor-like n=1 Tax=Lycorma delicatula TaxID=130591 RepID=UPI003F5159EF